MSTGGSGAGWSGAAAGLRGGRCVEIVTGDASRSRLGSEDVQEADEELALARRVAGRVLHWRERRVHLGDQRVEKALVQRLGAEGEGCEPADTRVATRAARGPWRAARGRSGEIARLGERVARDVGLARRARHLAAHGHLGGAGLATSILTAVFWFGTCMCSYLRVEYQHILYARCCCEV